MSQIEISFRNATIKDLPQIIPLVADIIVSKDPLQYADEIISDPPLESYANAFQEILKPPNEAIVGVIGDQVVCYLQLTYIAGLMRRGRRRCIVEDVRVSSKMRGLNIGRDLMNQAIIRAKENNCWVLQLTTNKWREDAIAFYEKMGFSRSHEGFRFQL